MKKVTFATLLFIVLSGQLIIGSDQDFQEFVQTVKKKIIVERSYKVGTEENLVLAPGQAARLDFKDNSAGVAEFLFFCNEELNGIHVIYRCTDNAEQDYTGTLLHLERFKDYRIVCAAGASKYLHIFSAWKPKDGIAFVKFHTTISLSEKDRQEIKEIDEARSHRKAAELQAIPELEWDFKEKIQPLRIIMDDPNNPNIIKLREKYELERLVSNAEDDYEKLRLVTGWVQKQWKHHGDNTPSRSDPLTILKEASEGKKFRCVEYAIVVAACTRSLGMPSRVLGLKRCDVETAKSGAGHVVAEVWLEQFNKWVFVDGQWGAIPEKDGIPLNAVEFQGAIACESPGLKIRFEQKVDRMHYLTWIAPYLYYFDVNLNQRFYDGETEQERISGSKGKVMLVPKGADKPKVFQIKYPIKNCTYISNPKTFYPQMNR
jgi:hypothetical protein